MPGGFVPPGMFLRYQVSLEKQFQAGKSSLMIRLLNLFLVIVFSVLIGSPSLLTEAGQVSANNAYYVATNGNNANPGSLQYPWRTIHKAADSVKAGDTVYIRGGTYHESNIFYADGTATAPITLTGFAGETVIIDGSSYTIPAKASGNALIQVYGEWYIIRDLTITGSGDQGLTIHGAHDTIDNVYSHHNWGWGILMTGDYETTQNSRVWSNSMMNENHSQTSEWSGGVTCARYPDYCTIRTTRSWENWGEGMSTFESLHTRIENNTVYDNVTNIYISDTRYALVQGNLIYCSPGNKIDPLADQIGILVYEELGVPIPLGPDGARNDSSDNSFLNNIIMGCDNNLFATQDQAANNLYAYNTFVNSDTYRPGYNANVQFITGTAPNQRFVNNLVYQSDNIAILQVDVPGIISFSNNLWSKAPPSSFRASGTGDVIGDPKLTRLGSPYSPNWYELTDTSPAVDAAKLIAETNVDFYGNARGALPDIGAFEFGVAPTTAIFLPCILKNGIY